MQLADLIDAVLDAGLLQFGAFQQSDKLKLYRLHLNLLPSYPAVLAQMAQAVAARIDGSPSRLVCTEEAVALAVLVSQALAIPLIVHDGKLGNPAHHLAGAYDVGHSAVLISLTTNHDARFVNQLVGEAEAVGLNIAQWVSLIGIRSVNEIRHVAAIDLRDMAETLVERGEVSPRMAAHIVSED